MTAPELRLIPIAVTLLVALIPFGRLSELGLLGLLGLALFARERLPARAFALAFALILIPMLLALPDAFALKASAESTFGYLRFGLFGCALMVLLRHKDLHQAEWLIGCVLVFWALDALLQAVLGHNLFGYANTQDRLNGVFGDGNLKLGATLAVLGPIVLEVAARRSVRWWALAALLLTWVILLAGTRAAWVMWACVLAIYSFWLLPGSWVERALKFIGLILAGGLMVGLSYQLSPRFAERIDRSALVFNGDRAAVDSALAYRLPIWETAGRMIAAHPINGVGARGFRHAYLEYAAPGDRWVDLRTQTGAAHPHQLLLEFLAETGVIGLAGWLALMGWMGLRYARASPAARLRARPYAASMLALAFPLNTHYAWFSSFWGLLVWLIIALYLVALREEPT